MKFTVITLFPNIINEYIQTSIIGNAIDKKMLEVNIIDLKQFGKGNRKNVDDTVYGGGCGMILDVETLDKAITYVLEVSKELQEKIKIVYFTPKGQVLDQNLAIKDKKEADHIICIAGHYEGIDERIFKLYNISEISIGDFVLTGGELPTLVYIDCIARLLKGVLKEEAVENESHTNYLLEEAQYTKPRIYKKLNVPEILLSGDHKKIEEYRLNQRIYITYKRRKDLFEKYLNENKLNQDEITKIIKEMEEK